ncbi:LppU/SCO3897 family protein [Kitasatospora kifunensis]|uniref:Protein kinase domain-containing protein n=1 Tax=Kitasatospora kifunensis TaxID=58351 RepID=A0A7W7VTS7_KITKI|nr:hypothetical protein [Kitasatospora kifunensis]MBB4921929.1 hypothetical protein [Kitasatospora kifunensis]
MTADPACPVDHTALALGARLGQGGQGSIYPVTNQTITVADATWEVVYKEYDPALLPDLDVDALTVMVRLRSELDAADGQWLYERTAWPAAVVQRIGHTSGFLMRAAPDRFHFDYRSLSSTTTRTRRLASLEYLLNDDAYVAGIGLSISDRDRLLVVADLAATLTRLHTLGIAVGDLSPKNLLFSTAPQPECFLIDCDAMQLRGATALPQAETPDWQLPAGEPKATPAGDAYKLALLTIRLFARHQSATDPAALSAISPELAALARAGLDPAPERRPTPSTWRNALLTAAATASATPNPGNPPPSHPLGPSPVPGPPKPKPLSIGARVGAAGVVAVTALVFVLAIVLSHTDSTPSASSSGGGPATTTAPWTLPPWTSPPWTPSTTDPAPPPTSDVPEPSPTPTPPAPPPDPIATAQAGDCLLRSGSAQYSQWASSDCGLGTYQVLKTFAGTTDQSLCDNVPEGTLKVSNTGANRVVCLSYTDQNGAYSAQPGQCVYGKTAAGNWGTLACETGAFTVVGRYIGTEDGTRCGNNQSETFPVQDWPDQSVTLCLTMNYPDDMWHATVNECMVMSGPSGHPRFTAASSCSQANVVFVSRTTQYNDGAWCNGYSWSTWSSSDYPQYAYTACYRLK